MILFPWLGTVQLNESADRLGIAQMMTQLPGVVLILMGGLLADKIDPRKILDYFTPRGNFSRTCYRSTHFHE